MEQVPNKHLKMSNTWNPDCPSFEFVYRGSQPGARSHAMRESWKRRRLARQHEEDSSPNSDLGQQPHNRELPLPEGCVSCLSLSADHSSTCIVHQYLKTRCSSYKLWRSTFEKLTFLIFEQILRARMACLLCCQSNLVQGLMNYYTIVGLQPYKFRTIKRTKIANFAVLGVTAYIPKIVDQVQMSNFPIACKLLLNTTTASSASLNIALAHSAVHLAHLHRREATMEAMTFKFAAIKEIRTWIQDSSLAYSDAATIALLQLITYEVCYP